MQRLNTTYKRVRRYLNGDPDILCKSDGRSTCNRSSILDPYKERLEQLLSEGKNYKETYEIIKLEGYPGKYTILSDYCSTLGKHTSSKAKSKVMTHKLYVTRSNIFRYLWSDEKEKISDETFEKIIIKYPKSFVALKGVPNSSIRISQAVPPIKTYLFPCSPKYSLNFSNPCTISHLAKFPLKPALLSHLFFLLKNYTKTLSPHIFYL